MNRFEKWLLRKLCNRLVIQGPQHKEFITDYYRVMAEEAMDEFVEDNKYTLHDFLSECQDNAFKGAWSDNYAKVIFPNV